MSSNEKHSSSRLKCFQLPKIVSDLRVRLFKIKKKSELKILYWHKIFAQTWQMADLNER